MAQYEHLPIYKKAFDLAVRVDTLVRGFSRYYKYSVGADMRELTRKSVRLIIRANSEADKRASLTALRDTIEEFKVICRVGKEVKAFKNFNTFIQVMEDAFSLSRQCEGWLKSMRGRT